VSLLPSRTQQFGLFLALTAIVLFALARSF
jgi:hypothetical protein